MASSLASFCFNSDCKEGKLEHPRKGWRLRSGEYAELCNHCSFAFEEGRFCETFHLNASGWRCCESCGKRVHCGCIVSAHGYVLLDAGGIECLPCAKKNVFVTSSPAWPASLFNHVPLSERFDDFPLRNLNQIGSSGLVGPSWQTPNTEKAFSQPDSHPRVPYGIVLPTGLEKLIVEQPYMPSLGKGKNDDPSERSMNGILKLGASGIHENGINFEEQRSFHSKNPQFSSFSKDDLATPQFCLPVPSLLPNGTECQSKRAKTNSRRPSPFLAPLAKQFHNNSLSGSEASNETHTNNPCLRGEPRGRNILLARYWPKMTDEELQKISGESKGVITPLFEKTLSASDAGRIGRLVLPKRCAEAYFPHISQPEGLPIKVQDLEGQEWQFQFRFWPNNNSRMYVLEGVTPCIQSMKLQAGDTVTFSRREPDGKLVMGCRKTSLPSSDQGNKAIETGNGTSARGEVSVDHPKQVKSADPATAVSQVNISGCVTKEATGNRPFFPRRRKSSTLGSKSKRLRIDDQEMIELKLTWEEAQQLLRPPSKPASVIMIEGFEFEEYEDSPILGRPTIFPRTCVGDSVQWAQCEDCLKWRKIPADALLSSRWTCSENLWDTERSRCAVAEELSKEQLEEMVSTGVPASCEKMKAVKHELDTFEALEGLDALANLALLGEGEGEGEALTSSAQATTKHPRHRPGCTCIVCIQPPSGKGQKHKETCTCNVCVTVKRRFRTMTLRREKKLSGKEVDSTRKKQVLASPEKVIDDGSVTCNGGSSSPDQKLVADEGSEDDLKFMSSPSFKGQIDLNIQPEREEELSPGSDSNSMLRLLQDATERHLRQQRLMTAKNNQNVVPTEDFPSGTGGNNENLKNGITLGCSDQEVQLQME